MEDKRVGHLQVDRSPARSHDTQHHQRMYQQGTDLQSNKTTVIITCAFMVSADLEGDGVTDNGIWDSDITCSGILNSVIMNGR